MSGQKKAQKKLKGESNALTGVYIRIILDYCRDNPDFARGVYPAGQKRKSEKPHWENLMTNLRAIEGFSKNLAQLKKSWGQLKRRTKAANEAVKEYGGKLEGTLQEIVELCLVLDSDDKEEGVVISSDDDADEEEEHVDRPLFDDFPDDVPTSSKKDDLNIENMAIIEVGAPIDVDDYWDTKAAEKYQLNTGSFGIQTSAGHLKKGDMKIVCSIDLSTDDELKEEEPLRKKKKTCGPSMPDAVPGCSNWNNSKLVKEESAIKKEKETIVKMKGTIKKETAKADTRNPRSENVDITTRTLEIAEDTLTALQDIAKNQQATLNVMQSVATQDRAYFEGIVETLQNILEALDPTLKINNPSNAMIKSITDAFEKSRKYE